MAEPQSPSAVTRPDAADFAAVSTHALIVVVTALLDQPAIDRDRLRRSVEQYRDRMAEPFPMVAAMLEDILRQIAQRGMH